MIATPIKKGYCYRVKGYGHNVIVIAAHPIDAILLVLGVTQC